MWPQEIPMPAQQRLGLDYLQGVSPSAAQPGQDEQEQAVIAVDPRSADTATEHDHLLTEQRILGQEFRSCAGEIPGGTDTYLRHRAGQLKQTLDRPSEGAEQGKRVHGHGASGWGFIDRVRAQCEPD